MVTQAEKEKLASINNKSKKDGDSKADQLTNISELLTDENLPASKNEILEDDFENVDTKDLIEPTG